MRGAMTTATAPICVSCVGSKTFHTFSLSPIFSFTAVEAETTNGEIPFEVASLSGTALISTRG